MKILQGWVLIIHKKVVNKLDTSVKYFHHTYIKIDFFILYK